jgi:hypothetical protein
VEAIPKWATQCHGVDTGLTAQSRAMPGMASQGGLAKQRWDMIPSSVRGPAWRGFAFESGARELGEWARGARAWGGLERGGDSPDGASSPRARRRFARGGAQPSSEVEIRPRGRPPSSEEEIHPRGIRPSSEAEIRLRGVRPSSEEDIHSRGIRPSSEAEISPSGVQPSSEAEIHGTTPVPLARRKFARGAPRLTV